MTDIHVQFNRLFGKFWLTLTNCVGLLSGLLDLYEYVIYRYLNTVLLNIKKQYSTAYSLQKTAVMPLAVTIDRLSKTKSYVALSGSYLFSDKKNTKFNQFKDTLFSYTIVNDYNKEYAVKHGLYTKLFPSYKDNQSIDCSVQNKQLTTVTDITSILKSGHILPGESTVVYCNLLWDTDTCYTAVRDTVTNIIQVPLIWATDYPGILRELFYCHLFLCTYYSILKCLSIITGYPVVEESGTVYKIDSTNKVYINKDVYSAPLNAVPAVSIGQYVHRGQALFFESETKKHAVPCILLDNSDSDMYTYINSIPIVSEVGLVYIPNAVRQVTSNILPVDASDSVLINYRAKCALKQQQTSAYKYTLPASMNPFRWMINNVWRSNFIYIVSANINIEDQILLFDYMLKTSKVDILAYLDLIPVTQASHRSLTFVQPAYPATGTYKLSKNSDNTKLHELQLPYTPLKPVISELIDKNAVDYMATLSYNKLITIDNYTNYNEQVI